MKPLFDVPPIRFSTTVTPDTRFRRAGRRQPPDRGLTRWASRGMQSVAELVRVRAGGIDPNSHEFGYKGEKSQFRRLWLAALRAGRKSPGAYASRLAWPSLLSGVFVAVLIGGTVSAETPAAGKPSTDGTAWTSFRHDYAQRGVASSPLPRKLELLWTHEAGDIIKSTAAIVGDRVYAASLKGEVFCLDRKTGNRIWTCRSRDEANPKTFLPGFKASPTVAGDTVYIGDEDGVFHAIDRTTGKHRWTFATEGEIVSSATLHGEQVIFGSHDNSLYALKAGDGTKTWQFVTEGMVNCSPAIAGNFTFVTGCDEHLRVIDIVTGKQTQDIPLGTYLIASPAVLDEMLYVGTYASEVVAVNWKSGKQIWAYKDAERELPYHSSAAVNEEYVIVGGHDKRLHCIHRTTGAVAWVFNTRGKVNSSPAIVDDRVFVGSDDGNVYCVSLKEGKELWRHTDGRPFSASPAIGEGCLVIGSEASAGPIYCFGEK